MEINWLQIGATLLGGGAVGALLAYFLTTWRNRQQPIAYTVSVGSLFGGHEGAGNSNFSLTLLDGDERYSFPTMYVADFVITNLGNADFKSFSFGATLNSGPWVVWADMTGADRLHKISVTELPHPRRPLSEVDFTVEPFNRNDSYDFKLYISGKDGPPSFDTIPLATIEPVRLVYQGGQTRPTRDLRLPGWAWSIIATALVVLVGIGAGALAQLIATSTVRGLLQPTASAQIGTVVSVPPDPAVEGIDLPELP